MTQAKVLVARSIFPETIAVEQHFEVEHNPEDATGASDLIARLQGKAGALTTGTERIDAEVLAAVPG
jgi:gluconate 2-dehydrogenase